MDFHFFPSPLTEKNNILENINLEKEKEVRIRKKEN